MKNLISTLLLLSVSAFASPNVAVTLLPADISGDPGAVVGWSFSISTLLPNRWALVNSVVFDTLSNIGTFNSFGFPLIIGSGVGNSDPYNETFNAGAQTGVGSFAISPLTVGGEVASGFLRFVFTVYDADPANDPAFDEGANTLSSNEEVSVAASVTVVPDESSPVPEPSTYALLGAGLGCLLLRQRTTRA
jgi:hypothetical protein